MAGPSDFLDDRQDIHITERFQAFSPKTEVFDNDHL